MIEPSDEYLNAIMRNDLDPSGGDEAEYEADPIAAGDAGAEAAREDSCQFSEPFFTQALEDDDDDEEEEYGACFDEVWTTLYIDYGLSH